MVVYLFFSVCILVLRITDQTNTQDAKSNINKLCANIWNTDREIMDGLQLNDDSLTSLNLLDKMALYNAILKELLSFSHTQKSLVRKICPSIVDLGLPRYFQVAVNDDTLTKCLNFTGNQIDEIYARKKTAVELWTDFQEAFGI